MLALPHPDKVTVHWRGRPGVLQDAFGFRAEVALFNPAKGDRRRAMSAPHTDMAGPQPLFRTPGCRSNHMSKVEDNPSEGRFELEIDDSHEIAAAYYKGGESGLPRDGLLRF
jgi:hypothetical protein